MNVSKRFFLRALVVLGMALGVYGCAKEKPAQKTESAYAEEQAASGARLVKPYYRPAGTGPAVWGPGDMYTFLVTGEESNNAIFQFEALVPKGGGPLPHIHHGEDESFYLVKGSLEVLVGDTIVSAKAGDFVFIPRGTVHRFKNVGDETAIQLVTFVPAGFEQFFKEVFPPVTDRNAAPPPQTEELIRKRIEAAPRHRLQILRPEETGKR